MKKLLLLLLIPIFSFGQNCTPNLTVTDTCVYGWAKTIQLCSHGVGKYGRCLGELHVDKLDGKQCLTLANVNELLIKEGHAVEYDGGKR